MEGNPVATCWPDETLKACFCSLLSPLDLYFSWDRICRSLLNVPDTQQSRRQLEEDVIRPLKSFLITELGFNPLLTGSEYMSLDQRCIKVDAFEFHSSAVEGLKQLSYGNYAAAQQRFARAKALYAGSYLPGVAGKIIANTRKDLEALYQKVVLESARQVAANPGRALKQVKVYE
jgi:two-component SAPR family response regulator